MTHNRGVQKSKKYISVFSNRIIYQNQKCLTPNPANVCLYYLYGVKMLSSELYNPPVIYALPYKIQQR